MKKNILLCVIVCFIFLSSGCATSNSSFGSNMIDRDSKNNSNYVRFPEYNVDALKGKKIFESDDFELSFIDYQTVNKQDVSQAFPGNYAAAFIEMELTITSGDPLIFNDARYSFNGSIPFDADVFSMIISKSGDLSSMIDNLNIADETHWDTYLNIDSFNPQYPFKMTEIDYDLCGGYQICVLPGKYHILMADVCRTYDHPDGSNYYSNYVMNNLYNCLDFKDGVVSRIAGSIRYEHLSNMNTRYAYIDYSTEENPIQFGLIESDKVLKIYTDEYVDLYCLFPMKEQYSTSDNNEIDRICYTLVWNIKNDNKQGSLSIAPKDPNDFACDTIMDLAIIKPLGKIRRLNVITPDGLQEENVKSLTYVDWRTISSHKLPSKCTEIENDRFDNYEGFAFGFEVNPPDERASYEVYTEIIRPEQFTEFTTTNSAQNQ